MQKFVANTLVRAVANRTTDVCHACRAFSAKVVWAALSLAQIIQYGYIVKCLAD